MEDLFLPWEDFERMVEGLRRKKNIVLQGPPGVGKSFVARRLAFALLGAEDDARVQTVQFHPSYAYEDFVQGYRPTEDGKFALKNGVFYEFCRSADPEKDHVFIIDEINRGNLSKILGEMMLLIEPDKRGTQFAQPLTYSKNRHDRFFVPERVHVIGLMNTADRSLALVDYALRRRFLFFDLQPRFTTGFREYLERRGAEPDLANLILMRIAELNKAITDAKDLGEGFRIGHSFFCPPSDVVPDRAWYDAVIEYEIAPLLREYWFDDKKQADHWIERLLR
jgi:5-methylcytosine-specific restriction endonuclease McrBC GTP-binding regulatory subunit McrB